jgi:ABC-type antimicrobial peptide transport system permease subunit
MAYENELHPVIVTEDVAESIFGSVEKAVGQYVYNENSVTPQRIVAVCSRFKNQEFEPYRPSFFDVMSPVKLAESIERMSLPVIDLLVRVRPGSERHFRDHFETDMGERLRVDNLYVSSVVPASRLRDEVVGQALRVEIRQMGYVSLFVLITVCLGVFGTFWLRTFQRRGETGIRLSMGASPQTIRRSMMTEGFCLMLIALPPALLVYLNLLGAEVLDVWRLPADATRVCIATAASIAIMSCVITFGIRLPAARASKLRPAEALQYE